jgi:hypothetical protein
MRSLKAFLPKIAGPLKMSPAALYERQRALMRLGILEGKEGWGPGSGVHLSAETLAALIASLLATDNLSEVDERVAYLLWADSVGSGGHCAVTHAKTFGEALTRILSSPGTRGIELRVLRPWLTPAEIKKGKTSSWFHQDRVINRVTVSSAIEARAELPSEVLSSLIREFQAATKEDSEKSAPAIGEQPK